MNHAAARTPAAPRYNGTPAWREMSKVYRMLVGQATRLVADRAERKALAAAYHAIILGHYGVESSTELTPLELNSIVRVLERHEPAERLERIRFKLAKATKEAAANDDQEVDTTPQTPAVAALQARIDAMQAAPARRQAPRPTKPYTLDERMRLDAAKRAARQPLKLQRGRSYRSC